MKSLTENSRLTCTPDIEKLPQNMYLNSIQQITKNRIPYSESHALAGVQLPGIGKSSITAEF